MNMGTEQMDGTQRLCRGTHPYSISLGSRPPTAAHVSSTATVSDRTSPCLKLLGDFLTHLNETKSSRQCSRSSLAWPFLSPTVSTPTRPPSPPSFSPLGSWAYLESWELCSKQAQPSLLTLTHHSDLRSHVTSSEKPSAERPSHTRLPWLKPRVSTLLIFFKTPFSGRKLNSALYCNHSTGIFFFLISIFFLKTGTPCCVLSFLKCLLQDQASVCAQ